MFIGRRDEDDIEIDEDWVSNKEQELRDDSSLFGMHYRDFEKEARDAYIEENS